MVKKCYGVNLKQIDLIKHAIGFERDKVKRGKYVVWRNYYVNGVNPCEYWEKLVEQGLARKYNKFGDVCYCVTEKGMDLLADILGVKIVLEARGDE